MQDKIIDKQQMISDIQSNVDKLNQVLKRSDIGTDEVKSIDNYKKNLNEKIKLLTDKDVATEEDQINTSRVVAISSSKIHSLTESKGNSNFITIVILSSVAIAATLIYFKFKK